VQGAFDYASESLRGSLASLRMTGLFLMMAGL